MSRAADAWAMAQQAPPVAKLLLLVLADHHNPETGLCRPSVKLLAEQVGVNPRTIRSNLAKLIELELVDTIQKFNADGEQIRDDYRLNIEPWTWGSGEF